MNKETTINAILNVPAYKAWYTATIRGFWALDSDDNIIVQVSDEFNLKGEPHRHTHWDNISVSIPSRFIIVSNR